MFAIVFPAVCLSSACCLTLPTHVARCMPTDALPLPSTGVCALGGTEAYLQDRLPCSDVVIGEDNVSFSEAGLGRKDVSR